MKIDLSILCDIAIHLHPCVCHVMVLSVDCAAMPLEGLARPLSVSHHRNQHLIPVQSQCPVLI